MNSRIVTLALGLALVVTAFAPAARAQSQLNVQSVGQIFIDATGHASGQNLNGVIVEASGLISSYTSSALGTKVFDAVSVEGFSATQKIQGVGSPQIQLVGSNAVISLTDTIQSTLRIEATSATSVDYKLASGIVAAGSAHNNHEITLTDSSGGYVGALVITGADGAASSASSFSSTAQGQLQAHLAQGDQVVFNARPVYESSQAMSQAQADALAQGNLAAAIVTEFSGSAQEQSTTNYLSGAFASADLSQYSTVSTTVSSHQRGSAILSYDLAYETLPTSNMNDVAVYADGTAAQRVTSAAAVDQAASANTAAYFVEQANGRTQVLASTPAFVASQTHTIAVAVAGAAQSQAQATSQAAADSSQSAFGEMQYYNGGKIAGQFVSGVVDGQHGSVNHVTALATGTEVFQSMTILHDQFANVDASGHTAVMTGADAQLTLVDDAYATMIVSAQQETSVVFNLSSNVQAIALSDDTIQLTGPHGYVGEMVLVKGSAAVAAAASATSTSRLVATGSGQVEAALDAESRVVVLSDSEAHAHADYGLDVVARAIASGHLAGHVLAGIQGGAAVAAAVDYYTNASIEATAKAHGSYDVYYQAATAQAFVFEARSQAAFAATAASDVAVTVDGATAQQASSAQAALSESGQAMYYVQTQADGTVDVIVNTGLTAVSGANVEIQSLVDSSARAAANEDAFGTFHVFQGGLAVGSFVSLVADQKAGVVDHVQMLSTQTEVFKSIQAGSGSFASSGQGGASTLTLANEQAELDFADTTSAYERVLANEQTTVLYEVGSNVTAALDSASVVTLTSQSGQYIGSMIITDAEGRAAANSYFVQTADGGVVAHLEQGAQVIFRTQVGIESELSADQSALMNQAIAAGDVGGQVYVQTQASLSETAAAALESSQSASGSASATATGAANGVVPAAQNEAGVVTTSVTTSYYNNVQIVTAAVQDQVDITISSSISTGKTLIVSLDNNTISGMMSGDAEILVDGQEAQQASSYADVLNPSAHGDVYQYFVLAGDHGSQVLISFPHFSTHTVTLKERDASPPSVFMYATMFLGALVAIESIVIVRRRWS